MPVSIIDEFDLRDQVFRSLARTGSRVTMAVKPNGHLHVPEGSPDTPASYYYGEDDIHPPIPEEIDDKLRKIAGPYSDVASRVTDLVTREAAERKQMIGGVDHMWVMLSDVTDFNPVGAKFISSRLLS